MIFGKLHKFVYIFFVNAYLFNKHFHYVSGQGVSTQLPSISPTQLPSISPTQIPSKSPTKIPSKSPTKIPSISPTKIPSISPTKIPSISQTNNTSHCQTIINILIILLVTTNVSFILLLVKYLNIQKSQNDIFYS
jgi:hypothetical protein